MSQLAAAGINDKHPTLVQRVKKDGDGAWWIQNVIGEHPESDLLMHPVWCLSDQAIVGFDKFLYKWDLSGELEMRRKLPTGPASSQCVINDGKLFITASGQEGITRNIVKGSSFLTEFESNQHKT